MISSQLATAQLPLHSYDLRIEENEFKPFYFLGDITVSGTFQGISVETQFDSYKSYFSQLSETNFFTNSYNFSVFAKTYVFPVFSQTSLIDTSVLTVNTTLLNSIQHSQEKFLENKEQLFSSFSNVTVRISKGVALFGSPTQLYQIKKNESYGIGGLVQLPLSKELPNTGLAIVSDQETVISTQTNTSLFYPFESEIEIVQEGQIVQRISNSDTVVLVNNQDSISLHQQSLLHFFPLLTNVSASAKANILLSQTDSSRNDLLTLLKKVNESISSMNSFSFQELLSSSQYVESGIRLISQLLNSGIIIVNASAPLIVDNNPLFSSSVIIGRGPSFNLQVNQQHGPPISMSGTSSLLFIDNYFYKHQTNPSEKGIILPVWSIIIWIVALISLLFYWYTKKQHQLIQNFNDTKKYLQKKWMKPLLFLLTFIGCFLIVDTAFVFQFGLSFFSSLTMQIDTLFISIFFIIQLLFLLLFYIMYALPVQLVHNVLCKTTFKNKYQPITKKLIIFPFLWIGLQLYLLIIFNIIISLLPIPSFPPIG